MSSDSLILHREHCFQHESSVARTCPFRCIVPWYARFYGVTIGLSGGIRAKRTIDRLVSRVFSRFLALSIYTVVRNERYIWLDFCQVDDLKIARLLRRRKKVWERERGQLDSERARRERAFSNAIQRVNIVWKHATLIWLRLAYISRVLCLPRICSFRWRVNIRSLVALNDLVGSSRSSSSACSCFDQADVMFRRKQTCTVARANPFDMADLRDAAAVSIPVWNAIDSDRF